MDILCVHVCVLKWVKYSLCLKKKKAAHTLTSTSENRFTPSKGEVLELAVCSV